MNELFYGVWDALGNSVIPATRITDLSGADTFAQDASPAVAVAPDGRIGIVWYRYFSHDNTFNYNILFMILDRNGGVVAPPVDITRNGYWGVDDDPHALRFWDPSIAATSDGRFTLAWRRYTWDGSTSRAVTWYAVRGPGGAEVRGPTEFPGGSYSWGANLTPLADGSLFLLQQTDNKLCYGRLDNSGNILTGLTVLNSSNAYYPDAAQLPNGNIVIAWSRGSINYMVLNAGMSIVRSPIALPSMSATSDYYPSVVRSGSRAVITWGDQCCDQPQPVLYGAAGRCRQRRDAADDLLQRLRRQRRTAPLQRPGRDHPDRRHHPAGQPDRAVQPLPHCRRVVPRQHGGHGVDRSHR